MQPISPPQETARLLLRPFREEDIESFFSCCKNPNLGRNAGWKPHQTLEESQAVLEEVFLNQMNIWAITLKESSELIGAIGLLPDPKRSYKEAMTLGYWLDEDHWGKGYMTEAVNCILHYVFEKLPVEIITATCYPHNLQSQRVLIKNGFIYEGTLHAAEKIYNGKIFDHLCYYLKRNITQIPKTNE